MNNKKNFLVLGISLALIVASLVFYLSARGFSKQGSYIEMKGLSERIVKADTAIWPITFQVRSNNIDDLYNEIEGNIAIVNKFLKDAGFEESEISVAPLDVYEDTYSGSLFRYNATVNMSVYTQKVDLVKTYVPELRQLVKQGLVLSNGYVSFEFSGLNDIKPEMLAEATQNAKISAEEFASNGGVTLGKVVRANQGVFDITDKDPGSPEYKKIRLVSSLRFLIK